MKNIIVYQGEAGANSHMACTAFYPDYTAQPCATFEEAFAAVEDGSAQLAMIPIENSVAGRVGDIHTLLPHASLSIIGERFLPIHHQFMAKKGVKLVDITSVKSHVMALGQCRKFIKLNNIKAIIASDTAGAAREISENDSRTQAAIASGLAAEIYGLEILAEDIEDEKHNTTRFIILQKDGAWFESASPSASALGTSDCEARSEGARGSIPLNNKCMTSFVFRVRNLPAALYKALGGFATNGVNMTKLESYMVGGHFYATQFYAEVEGHPDDASLKRALEELDYFCKELRIIGVYAADPFRETLSETL